MTSTRQIVALLMIAAATCALAACGSSPDPIKTQHALTWLKAYYKRAPLGGGWKVAKISSNGHDLNIYVRVPDSQAGSLMKLATKRQLRILSATTCPSRGEAIWHIIDKNQVIYVHFSGGRYGVFLEFDCAHVEGMFDQTMRRQFPKPITLVGREMLSA